MSGLMTEKRERGLRDGGDDRSDAVAIGGEGNGPPGKIIFCGHTALPPAPATALRLFASACIKSHRPELSPFYLTARVMIPN